jgi:hypothetical protein
VICGYSVGWINAFGQSSGFDFVLETMKSESDWEKNILLLDFIFLCSSNFTPGFAEKFLSSLIDYGLSSVSDGANNVLLEQKEVLNALQKLEKRYLQVGGKSAKILLLQLSNLSHLLDGSLKQKLGALDSFNALLQSIGSDDTLTSSTLIAWLHDSHLEILFTQASHEEILKKTSKILIFLAKNHAWTERLLNSVWLSMIGQNETTMQVLSDSLSQCTEFFSLELLEILSRHIQTLSLESTTPLLCSLLKRIMLESLNFGEKSESVISVGLSKLLNILETSPESSSLYENTFRSLLEVAKNPAFQSQMMKITVKIFHSMRENPQKTFHASITKEILEIVDPSTREAVVLELVNLHNGLNVCLKSLIQFVSILLTSGEDQQKYSKSVCKDVPHDL